MQNKKVKKAVLFFVVLGLLSIAFAPTINSLSQERENQNEITTPYQPLFHNERNVQQVLSEEEYNNMQEEAYIKRDVTRDWYWKEPYPNYAPHSPGGMPDFDQKQDQWKAIEPGPNGVIDSTVAGDDVYNPDENCIAPGPNCHLESNPVGDDVVVWVFCGPVAVANCLWWFDSKYADPQGFPGDGKDRFSLVEDYGVGDDHSSDNVPLLIEELASKMQTCSKGTTYIGDMQDAIDDWFVDTGLDEMFEEQTYEKPTFNFIEEEIERSQDVILLMGYYDYVDGEKQIDQLQPIFEIPDMLQGFTWWDYQSFVPTVERLDAIQICIFSNGPPCDIEINVYDVYMGTPIGTAVLNPGYLVNPTWVQFHFEPYVPLIPGNLYYFDVRQLEEEYHYEWFYMPDSMSYPPGQGWMDTMPVDYYGYEFDWTFITEYYDPIPGYYRTGGHYVTCAGVNSEEEMIAFSDPCWDIQNPQPSDHNDAENVSHDIYSVGIGSPDPDLDYEWWIMDYPSDAMYTIVEQAVVICPVPDEEPPTLDILTPENAVYFFDTKVFPFFVPVCIGQITVECSALDNILLDRVEFYLNDVLQDTVTAEPCIWEWSTPGFSKYTVKVIAYDFSGNNESKELSVWKFF